MKKKSKSDIGKMVDAKAKGKQPRNKVATEDARAEAAEVDVRKSKAYEFYLNID